MKKLLVSVLAFVLVFGLAACGETADKDKGDAKEEGTQSASTESIGTVNGEEINAAEYEMFYKIYLDMIAKQQNLSGNIKDMLVDNALLVQDLEKNKVEVSQDSIDKVREEMIAEVGTKDDYKEKLKEQGFTEEAFEVLVKMRANAQAHFEWYKEEHPVDDKAIEEYYNEHKDELDLLKVSHILLETEAEALDIKAKLDAGEDFAELAKEYSTDDMTKIVGGDLGEIAPKYSGFDPTFLEALEGLKVGEVSTPVQTQFGFHIIKLTEKKEGVEASKEKIENILTDDDYATYHTQIRENAEIKFNDEEAKEDDKEATEEGAEKETEKEEGKEADKADEEKTEEE